MKRRDILKGLPFVGAAAVTPALATAAPISPRERLDIAIEELKAAAKEAYPQIETWVVGDGNTHNCPLVISGLAQLNPHPEPLLADDVKGTDAFAKWSAWESKRKKHG